MTRARRSNIPKWWTNFDFLSDYDESKLQDLPSWNDPHVPQENVHNLKNYRAMKLKLANFFQPGSADRFFKNALNPFDSF